MTYNGNTLKEYERLTQMSKVTIKRVNKALEAAGINGELVKGNGYFYFCGQDFNRCSEQGVYGVYLLSDLSVERWVAEAKAKID